MSSRPSSVTQDLVLPSDSLNAQDVTVSLSVLVSFIWTPQTVSGMPLFAQGLCRKVGQELGKPVGHLLFEGQLPFEVSRGLSTMLGEHCLSGVKGDR